MFFVFFFVFVFVFFVFFFFFLRGVPKGALRTHSALQAPLWGSLVTCIVYCLRVCQC